MSNRRITVIDMEEPPEHHHFLVQAPVPPADVDGLAVVTVGTAIFGLVSVVFAFAYDWLAAHDHTLWLQVSVSRFRPRPRRAGVLLASPTAPACGRPVIIRTIPRCSSPIRS